jgi:hypothetical protein
MKTDDKHSALADMDRYTLASVPNRHNVDYRLIKNATIPSPSARPTIWMPKALEVNLPIPNDEGGYSLRQNWCL